MIPISVFNLKTALTDAALPKLRQDTVAIGQYAITVLNDLGANLASVITLAKSGDISEEQSRLHLYIMVEAAQVALLTIEGLSRLAVEEAINAALKAVSTLVNTAIGFVLI